MATPKDAAVVRASQAVQLALKTGTAQREILHLVDLHPRTFLGARAKAAAAILVMRRATVGNPLTLAERLAISALENVVRL